MFIKLGGVFTVVAVAIWLWALFDSITTPAERVRSMPKALWIIVVLIILPPLGAIAWFLLGRPRVAVAGSAVPRRRSTAPDDDPEFLLKLRDDLRRGRPEDPEA